jgi:oxygen-independent coproporphyrinogen-3 oxidase
MAGVYIHIPFCAKACFYCDFHFSVNRKKMDEMVEALLAEIKYFGNKGKQDFFGNQALSTIYFGGGTPSLLSGLQIQAILNAIRENYNLQEDLEITLESNPDDLTLERCRWFKEAGINRLSIGIQSFYEEHLHWMNRSHNAEQAKTCVENAIQSGIDVITVDLIYGFPGLTDEQWLKNLEMANDLKVNHLSCYSLTLEDRTPLKKLVETGRYNSPREEDAVRHFEMLMDWAETNGWEHYEISNFCRKKQYSKHNTGYWKGEKYLGIGPSAHSYNKLERRWNVRDNLKYIEKWVLNEPCFEIETLSISEKANDYILTSLRTSWGLNINELSEILGSDFYTNNQNTIQKFINIEMIEHKDNILLLTKKGKLYADGIASELFVNV